MAERKSFLLRIPPELMNEMNRWAKDELRSLNAQIEYVLRDALRRRGKTLPSNDQDANSISNEQSP